MVWLEEQLALLGVQSANISLNYPYLIPEYPQSKGKTFDPSLPDAAALANLYHNSWLGITQFIALIDGFARLTVWPHHFDMATLQVVKDTGDPETSASIGVGMSPGDHHIDEPYFYMNSWPYAQQDDFPELKYGEWYEEDWAGAILKYSELVKEISPAIQREILQTFLESTYQVLRATII